MEKDPSNHEKLGDMTEEKVARLLARYVLQSQNSRAKWKALAIIGIWIGVAAAFFAAGEGKTGDLTFFAMVATGIVAYAF